MRSTDLAAEFRYELGGSELDPALSNQVVELRVETTAGLPDVCTLRLTEAAPGVKDSLTVIDDARFGLGKPVKVKIAATAGGALSPVFDGEITAVEADLGNSGGGPLLELIVTAHDKSHRMTRGTTTRTLRQVTVGDVARKLAGENGLTVGELAALQGGAHEEIFQSDETDWAFLSRLVREHGGELDIAGGALHIIDPSKAEAEVAKLVWGETLERFHVRASSLGQVEEISVQGWDPKKKTAFVKQGKPNAAAAVETTGLNGAVSGTKRLVSTSRVSTDAQAAAMANGLAQRSGHERVTADAVAKGDPRLLAGTYVAIDGVGKRFGGKHRVVSATHVLGGKGYQTRLVLGAGGLPIAAALRNGSVNGSGKGPFSGGLAIGIVTDNGDPDKLGRVKVKYPLLPDVESGWVRVARESAGKERGTVAIPHVNDEVVIGFMHGDIHRPFVLGVLFNGVDTPGADLIKTTSSVAARYPRDLDVATKKKTLLASDEGLTVTTSKGPVEVAAGKELKIAASKGGAPSPITIETTGQIKANGKQGVEIAANGPLKITSTAPVTIESNAALQLKGSVVQVQASGVLQLSGATVMIG